jgi:hypothetical protein
MVETLLAMLVICLVFAGAFQVSSVLAAREVLQHAAARGARAKTVGFNRWMVEKCVYVAAIPTSGRLLEPPFENVNPALRQAVADETPGGLWSRLLREQPVSSQAVLESARIPEFLAAENHPRSRFVLDYEHWRGRGIRHWVDTLTSPGGDIETEASLRVAVAQNLPLTAPMHRAFYAADEVELRAESEMESHYPLYIEDASR